VSLTVKIMRRVLFIPVVSLLAIGAAAAQPGGQDTDRKNVELTLEKYVQSVKTADLALAAEVWSHAADIVVVTPFGRFQGWDSVRENLYVNFLQKGFSARNLQPGNVAIRIAGDTAWAVFDWTFTGQTADGQTITSQGWESHVYQRTRNGWAIVALHYSVPPPR
jgi:ketosteroid isomerase-like protein